MNVLHPDEVRQLLGAVDLRDSFGPRDHAMLVFCLHTGVRVSELIALDVRQVAVDGVPRQAMHLVHTKGSQTRVVPLNVEARGAVAAIVAFNRRRGFSVAPDRPLLVTRYHDRMTVRAVQRLVKALREKAQLDVPASPHSLRHAFATGVMSCNSNLRIVQKLLGHKRLATVEIYSHPTREDLRVAVERAAERGPSSCV